MINSRIPSWWYLIYLRTSFLATIGFVRNGVVLNYIIGYFEIRDISIAKESILFERDTLDRVFVYNEENITYFHVINNNNCKSIANDLKTNKKVKIIENKGKNENESANILNENSTVSIVQTITNIANDDMI